MNSLLRFVASRHTALLLAIVVCPAFAFDDTSNLQIVRQVIVSASGYAGVPGSGARVTASKHQTHGVVRPSDDVHNPEKAHPLQFDMPSSLPIPDGALEAHRMAEYLAPLGSAEFLQRIAGEQWIITLADNLVVAESRDSQQVLRFSLTRLLSSSSEPIVTLNDSRLTYDRDTHQWAMAAVTGFDTGSPSLLVAISATEDPTGHWQISEIRPAAESPAWTESPTIGLSRGVLTVNTTTAERTVSFTGSGWGAGNTGGIRKTRLCRPGTGTTGLVAFSNSAQRVPR